MSDDMVNRMVVTGFLLLGFSEVRELQVVHIALFLLVYQAALMGKLLFVAVIALNRCLHTPMYFFLRNVALIDLSYVSFTVPKSTLNSLLNVNSISLPAGASRTEMALLTVMSHARFMAICHPLHFDTIMHHRPRRENLSLVTTIGLPFFCFVLIVVSYALIFRAVLRMPASEGLATAFSTCVPHLIIVTLFITSSSSAYLKPILHSPSVLQLTLSMFYSVMSPTLNPLIYSLRNPDM
ncbi:putative olfactory receptor 14L1 [Tachyglossus aculeatus]|uniref:putative olfactory receptor 14L1 n=1 Tax=Tachyglossus aculeatus TaxID=9261 RepID=UPI0018F3977A|nr:putative olfactory receptor 14L1 [Tachyglossus aculeatus]